MADKPLKVDNVEIRKHLSFKDAGATISQNQISGAAAKMGNMDRGADVIFPGCGCFDKAIPGFLANGSIMIGHKWSSLPIGFPLECEERGRDLWSSAQFHSTADAQEARTVAMERKDAGKTVGLSIGFRLASSGYDYFENGEELLAFAADTLKLDMSLFDVPTIEKYSYWCRGIWAVKELYEWSIVTVPMNAEALAADIKSARAASIVAAIKGGGLDDESTRLLLAGGVPALLAARPDLSHTDIMLDLSGMVKSSKFDAKLQDKKPGADDLDILRRQAEAEHFSLVADIAAIGDF